MVENGAGRTMVGFIGLIVKNRFTVQGAREKRLEETQLH